MALFSRFRAALLRRSRALDALILRSLAASFAFNSLPFNSWTFLESRSAFLRRFAALAALSFFFQFLSLSLSSAAFAFAARSRFLAARSRFLAALARATRRALATLTFAPLSRATRLAFLPLALTSLALVLRSTLTTLLQFRSPGFTLVAS